MSAATILLTTILAVPPGDLVVNHAQPYHWAQPTIRRFERRQEDEARRRNWDLYVRDLDDLWKEYRRAGSTRRAWRTYKIKADQAKRSFIVNDPYYAPIVRDYEPDTDLWGASWDDTGVRLSPEED